MLSQFVMTYPKKRPKKALPLVFTEHGVTMLASVLRSKKAIKMNIAIVEAFISLKEFALNHKEIAVKLKELEKKYDCMSSNKTELFQSKDKRVLVLI